MEFDSICELKNLPTTAKEAREVGSKYYFTRKPCIRGHICKRTTKKSRCVICVKEDKELEKLRNPERVKDRKRREYERHAERYREKSRDYYKENRERVIENSRARYNAIKNSEEHKAKRRQYNIRNREKISSYKRIYREEHKEYIKEQMKRHYAKRANKPVEEICSVPHNSFDYRSMPHHFYVLKITAKDGESFIGYGISSVINVRLSTHKHKLSKNGFSFELLECAKLHSGEVARKLESEFVDSFPPSTLSVDGFRRESTKYTKETLDYILERLQTLGVSQQNGKH